MSDALHAEWTKLRTAGGTGWYLLGCIALTIALGTAAAAAVNYPSIASYQDTTKISLTGVVLGQAVIVLLAVLAIAGEYSTGMIRVTLTAVPHRPTVLAAKAIVVGCVTLVAGTIAVLGSVVAAHFILAGNGFTRAHGYQPLSLVNGPTLRAAAGSVLYLALVAMLSLGIAAATRDGATAIGTVLGLLYLFPIVANVVTDPRWQRHLEQIAPMTAGLTIQDTTNLGGLPVTPWEGLGVLAAWAAAALLAGGLLLRLRDA